MLFGDQIIVLDEWMNIGHRRCSIQSASSRSRPIQQGGGGVPDVGLLDNLLATWHFNAGTNSFIADFGAYELQIAPPTTVSAGKLLNAINVASGRQLVGVGLEGVFSFGPPFSFTTTPFTWQFWVKFTSFAAPHVDLIYVAANNGGYILRISSAGTVTFFTGNGGGYDGLPWGSNLSTGIWYQIIFGRDTDTTYLQINTESVLGTVVSLGGLIFLVDNPIQNFDVPGYSANAVFQLDELAAWSGVFLSLLQRTTLWNNGAGLAWPFTGL